MRQVLVSVLEDGQILVTYLRDGLSAGTESGYTAKGWADLLPSLADHLFEGVEDSGEPN